MISVIMTTFNREALLPRAIDSVLAQDIRNWELVIIDDGSSDNTRAVLETYSSLDNRISHFHQANAGLSVARNAGIAKARRNFITFLDSDDEYRPNHLSLREAFMVENPDTDLIHGGIEIVGGPDTVPDRNNPGQLIAIADCFVGGTFFARRRAFHVVGGFRKPDFGNDYDFMKRALPLIRVEKTSYPTYVYHRETPDSMCNLMKEKPC
jgi:glycosyltransferase involved in cell wall biosynthesis